MTIDEELQAALDVDPSPEFLARVRTRIANEPAPSRWTFRSGSPWMWLASGAAVAAVAIVAVLVSRPNSHRNVSGAGALTARVISPTAQMPREVLLDPARGGSKDPPYTRTAVAEPFRAADDGAEIVVDRREAIALRALLAGSLLPAEEALVVTPATPMEIEPIAIAPLEIGGEGVRQ